MLIFREVYISRVRKYDSIAALTAFARYPCKRITTSSFWSFKKINTFYWPETVYAQTSSFHTVMKGLSDQLYCYVV